MAPERDATVLAGALDVNIPSVGYSAVSRGARRYEPGEVRATREAAIAAARAKWDEEQRDWRLAPQDEASTGRGRATRATRRTGGCAFARSVAVLVAAHGRSRRVRAVFESIEVLGQQEMTLHLTPTDVAHGFAEALPQRLDLVVVGYGRGERI